MHVFFSASRKSVSYNRPIVRSSNTGYNTILRNRDEIEKKNFEISRRKVCFVLSSRMKLVKKHAIENNPPSFSNEIYRAVNLFENDN